MKILTDPDKAIYDNILHSFVGIAAVQIGLTDILKEIGVVPDYIIGNSVVSCFVQVIRKIIVLSALAAYKKL